MVANVDELVAEARRWGDALPEMWGPDHVVNRLADALEAMTAERVAAGAIIGEMRMIPSWHNPETGLGGYDVDGQEWYIIRDLIAGRTKPRELRIPRPARRRAVRDAPEATK